MTDGASKGTPWLVFGFGVMVSAFFGVFLLAIRGQTWSNLAAAGIVIAIAGLGLLANAAGPVALKRYLLGLGAGLGAAFLVFALCALWVMSMFG